MIDQPAGWSRVPAPESGYELVTELAILATELHGCDTEEQVLALTLERAQQLVPGSAAAGVLRLGQPPSTVAHTDELVLACDQAQIALRDGPAFAAVADRTAVAVRDTTTERRWPMFGIQAATSGIRSLVAVVLGPPDRPQGVLTLYSRRPGAFGSSSQFVVSSLAVHAGLAVSQARQQQHLRAGMANRAVIGEAIGVLMHRRRITSEQAFELLLHASQRDNVKLREIARTVVETRHEPARARLDGAMRLPAG